MKKYRIKRINLMRTEQFKITDRHTICKAVFGKPGSEQNEPEKSQKRRFGRLRDKMEARKRLREKRSLIRKMINGEILPLDIEGFAATETLEFFGVKKEAHLKPFQDLGKPETEKTGIATADEGAKKKGPIGRILERLRKRVSRRRKTEEDPDVNVWNFTIDKDPFAPIDSRHATLLNRERTYSGRRTGGANPGIDGIDPLGYGFGNIPLPESRRELNRSEREILKKVIDKAMELCDGKKPTRLTDDECREIAKHLEGEGNEKKAAALFIIGKRRAREYLDDVVRLAEDEDRVVRSFAFRTLYYLGDSETIKKTIMLLRNNRGVGQEPVIDALNGMAARYGYDVFIDATEKILASEWFREEMERKSEVFRRILGILGDIDGNKQETYWWIIPEERHQSFVNDRTEREGTGILEHKDPGEVVLERLRNVLTKDAKNRIESITGRMVEELGADELIFITLNPLSELYGEETRRLARDEIQRSVGRNALERGFGKSIGDISDEELGKVIGINIVLDLIKAARKEQEKDKIQRTIPAEVLALNRIVKDQEYSERIQETLMILQKSNPMKKEKIAKMLREKWTGGYDEHMEEHEKAIEEVLTEGGAAHAHYPGRYPLDLSIGTGGIIERIAENVGSRKGFPEVLIEEIPGNKKGEPDDDDE